MGGLQKVKESGNTRHGAGRRQKASRADGQWGCDHCCSPQEAGDPSFLCSFQGREDGRMNWGGCPGPRWVMQLLGRSGNVLTLRNGHSQGPGKANVKSECKRPEVRWYWRSQNSPGQQAARTGIQRKWEERSPQEQPTCKELRNQVRYSVC